MNKDTVQAKITATREAGGFDAEIPEDGFRLDMFLQFVAECFPGVSHDQLFIMRTDSGKICVDSEQPVVAH